MSRERLMCPVVAGGIAFVVPKNRIIGGSCVIS